MRITWYLTGALIVVALAVPFVLSLMFNSADRVKPGTVDYWLAVPNAIKGVPIVSACDQPLYSTAGGQSSVVYQTEVTAQHAQDVLQRHFEASDCAIADDQAITCPSGDRVTINVVPGESCAAVTVMVQAAN